MDYEAMQNTPDSNLELRLWLGRVARSIKLHGEEAR